MYAENTPKDIIKKYKDTREQFKQQCRREGLLYDEDILYDTMLKCHKLLTERGVKSIDAAKNYLWYAFKKNMLRERNYSRNKLRCDVETSELEIIDEEYDASIDELYNNIVNDILKEFGDKWCEMFRLHYENNTMYNKLSKDFNVEENEIHNTFKSIRKYIRKKYRDKQ